MSATGAQPSPNDYCPGCTNLIRYCMVEDEHNGDIVCRETGLVLDRVIDDSPVKRVYEKDNADERASKQQHTVYDPLLDDTIRSSHYLLDADEGFLHEGFGAIQKAMGRLFPDIRLESAERLAQYYFKEAFKLQLDEKKGITQMKRKTSAGQPDNGNRKKFSRRKAFIVSSILAALRIEGITKPDHTYYDVQDLNSFVEGKNVSQNSKATCWRKLGISFDNSDARFGYKRGRNSDAAIVDERLKKPRGQNEDTLIGAMC